MATERLSADDNRILGLERGPIAGHTLKLMVCEAPLDASAPLLEELRERVAERIARVPRCREALKPNRVGRPSWAEYPAFDLAEHVRPVAAVEPVDAEALRRIASRLMTERLPRDRPLWCVDLVEGLEGGGFALVLRTHHAMADGVTTLRMAEDLLWDERDTADGPTAPQTAAPPPARPGRLAASARAIADLPAILRRELRRDGSPSPFATSVGDRREIAFVSAPLEQLKQTAKAVAPGVTLNDVVLASSAGGIRRWLDHVGASAHGLRAKVPVSLHNHDHDAHALGNRDSFMFVDLPVGEPDPIRRLLAINAETSNRKNHHDAETLDAMLKRLHELGRLDRVVERRAMDPRVFTVNVSNVPGPRRPVSILGGRMRELLFVAEIAEMHALRISVVSAAGQMFFGLCVDPDAVPDLDLLAAGIEAEIGELSAGAGRA